MGTPKPSNTIDGNTLFGNGQVSSFHVFVPLDAHCELKLFSSTNLSHGLTPSASAFASARKRVEGKLGAVTHHAVGADPAGLSGFRYMTGEVSTWLPIERNSGISLRSV